jgi:hypothetical protein
MSTLWVILVAALLGLAVLAAKPIIFGCSTGCSGGTDERLRLRPRHRAAARRPPGESWIGPAADVAADLFTDLVGEGGELVGKLRNRLSRKVDSDLAAAVMQWAAASEALLDLVSTGSLISDKDRDLVVELIRARLDGPAPLPDGVDLDQLHDLATKLRGDSERAARSGKPPFTLYGRSTPCTSTCRAIPSLLEGTAPPRLSSPAPPPVAKRNHACSRKGH